MPTEAAADLPPALTRVPRTATQPDGSQLLAYDQVMARIDALSASPRVRVELLGASRDGRAIPLIAITGAVAVEHLDQIRADAARLTRPAVTHQAADAPAITQPQLNIPPPGFRLPVLFQSSNFGMEASQIPSLLELAEFFVTDESPDTLRVLDQLVILITPVINPDGMELARAHWQARPLSPAWPAQGNRFGIEVTREYLHQTEPETRALARLVRMWHPFLVWEVHEDGIGLGWGHPQTCLCPPISPPDAIGLESPVAASVNDPRLYTEFQRYGKAIAGAWAELGFDFLYDPEGRHGWPRYPVPGYENLVSPPETRFTQSMQLRGVPAFITESCRVPGSQTWADRIAQKVSAGKAVAVTAASATGPLIDLVSSVHRDGLDGPGSEQFFLLPLDQDRYTLSRSLDILASHEISVYRTQPDMPEPALVVPASQPLRATIELLLAAGQGRHQSLGATLGLRVRPSTALAEPERAAWAAASLRPLSEPVAWPDPMTDDSQWYEVTSGHHATTVASRLLRTPGAEIWRDVSPEGPGSLFVRGGALAAVAAGLHVSARPVPNPGQGAVELRLPRIGLYTGQGELENRFNGTLLRWFLAEWELPFSAIGPADISPAGLGELDIFIVPAGDAAAILTGVEPATVWHRPPWEPDGDSTAVSAEQVAALRDWVTAGGLYVGIDAGGGVLGSQDQLGLVDAHREQWNLGAGLVELSIKDRQSPLFAGISGSWAPDGAWREGVIDAMYTSHPHSGLNGGCLFSVGSGATALATVSRSLPVGDVPHIAATESFEAPNANAAIVGAQVGAGYAVLFGIEPTYRALFLRTGQLIANLILHSAVRRWTA
jgi:glutamine amidotransferase-like uncharacterized protein